MSSREIPYIPEFRPGPGCHLLHAVNILPRIIMYLSSLALPLATFFSTTALVSATPQGTATLRSLSPVSQPTNATNPHDPRECIKNRRPWPFSQRYLVLAQCEDAISQLPTSDAVGLFRDHGEPDLYFLPQTRRSGSCGVTVSLPYTYKEETSSWNELKLDATHLAEKCCDVSLGDDLAPNDNSLSGLSGLLHGNNKGAYVPAGLHGKIRIDLMYIAAMSEPPITPSIGGNATNLTSDAVLEGTTAISTAASGTNLTSDAVAAA